MENRLLFRIAFALAIVVTLGISGYFRRKADNLSDESITRDEEGTLILSVLRLAPLVFFATSLLYIVRPQWVAWATLPLPDTVRWIAAAFSMLAAPALAFWVLRSLGHNVTPTVVTRETAELVTSGPYRWVRHPLYTVGSLFWLSQSVLAANWFMALVALVGLAGVSLRTPLEEARLIERFGDSYRDYMQRTGRYLPRLSR